MRPSGRIFLFFVHALLSSLIAVSVYCQPDPPIKRSNCDSFAACLSRRYALTT